MNPERQMPDRARKNASSKSTRFFSFRIELWGLFTAGGAILAATSVLGFFGKFSWFLDLFSHFRVQLFLGLTLVTLVLLFRRRYRAPAFFGLFALANLCTIVPFYFGALPPPDVASRSYRGLLMNVNTATGDPVRVAQVIRDIDPDIVVLEEVNGQWLSELSATLSHYSHSNSIPRDDNFGIALFSKFPVARSKVLHLGEADVPTVVAELELPDGPITVLGTHPLPPGGSRHSRLRNEQLGLLPEVVKAADSPVLLLGDLNATPWSFHFKRLLSESGLQDCSKGRGVLGTWPTYLPVLRIPIDHCLFSDGIYVTERGVGPKTGSDHYPLIVDFVLARK